MTNNPQIPFFSKNSTVLAAFALDLYVCPLLNFTKQFNSAPTLLYSTHSMQNKKKKKVKK